MLAFAVASLALWVVILCLPWRPWAITDALDPDPAGAQTDLGDITALVPARDEAEHIALTLRALDAQGPGVAIVLVDDQSTDGTAAGAAALNLPKLTVLTGTARPAGWTGKLWALEQGRQCVHTDLTLLVDADVVLDPGVVAALATKLRTEDRALVSLMVALRMDSAWERWLMPAFVYFFRLLYPFRLSNGHSRRVAAAAGGCILLRTDALAGIGGFAALRGALIDDCALARLFKRAGHRTWLGLTHSAHSRRAYGGLWPIWDMVARSAYTQLHHSIVWLGVCTLLMLIAFAVPLAALGWAQPEVRLAGGLAYATMMLTYLPTLRFYGRSPLWAVTLAGAGLLYLGMTWASALRYWRGKGAHWKGRSYGRRESGT
jgi:hopene-associated glycosyltransferase HpnB